MHYLDCKRLPYTKVKATGFGRINFRHETAISELFSTIFGTDLPSTRTSRPFVAIDIGKIIYTLAENDTS